MSQQAAVARRKIAGERTRRPGGVDPLGADDVGAGSSARRKRRVRLPIGRVVPGWLLLGLVALTAVVLVFDGVTWARSASHESAAASLGPESLTAASAQAEKAAEQILSYDYASLKAGTAASAALMTPAYAQTFTRTVDDLLADPAARQHGVVSAKVMASGVVSADAGGPGEVNVLLFVDQTSTTKDDKTPQTALNRVLFTMVYADGRWLVDDVTAL